MKFCTKLDHTYLDRGLVLYESLRKYHPQASLHVLSLSDEAFFFLRDLKLEGLVPISIETIVSRKPELAAVRNSRTRAEFAFTTTPFIVLETLEECRPGELAVHVDADMMFFSSVDPYLDAKESADVVVTPHRFSEHLKEQERFGLYNTGFTAFRKTANGLKCASWWAEKCLEWCGDRAEDGKFADQKYIERFSSVVPTVEVLDHPGVNCAPWNASGHKFLGSGEKVEIDQLPLVIYHFSKVKRVSPACIATRARLQGVRHSPGLNRKVYRKYARNLMLAGSKFGVPSEWQFASQALRGGTKHRALLRDEQPTCLQKLARVFTGDYETAGSSFLTRMLIRA